MEKWKIRRVFIFESKAVFGFGNFLDQIDNETFLVVHSPIGLGPGPD
jgi:hypothetical protein